MTNIDLRVGECVALMNSLEPDSVHAIITDPPYDLTTNKKGSAGFMGKAWDATGVAFDPATWEAALRVLKPGGHLVAFGGTRTHHRMMVAIEDAGFELRDMLMWLYGTGFPKSQSVGKAIDKAAGVERKVVGSRQGLGSKTGETYSRHSGFVAGEIDITEPATDAARKWEGWGTALKPAWEPVVLARKPLTGTVAANVMEHGTGALNIDAARIGSESGGTHCANRDAEGQCRGHQNAGQSTSGETVHGPNGEGGRWPANVVMDPEAAALLDGQTGKDVSRFFYCAKASRKERELGLDKLPEVRRSDGREKDIENPRLRTTDRRNHHPTVKPLDLMRWLTRMVTPLGGTVLDPFLGSGTSGIAVALEDPEATFIGIDLEAEYVEIAEARIAAWQTALVAGEVSP